MLERSHLEILRAVREKGSLTSAAEALFLSQSALSHAIKKLESQLNTSLWEKEGRLLRMTAAGEYLINLAERLLPQFEHAELLLTQIAEGQKGILRIGMECHPCYRWLLKVVAPYLEAWPLVDVDVIQKFTFGGIGALFSYDIDVLVTPDPFLKPGLVFTPVYRYEQVLVVGASHKLANKGFVLPEDLAQETLITYPVEKDRLDIYVQFLTPANCYPNKHKTIETTDIMLQMVAAGRGVAALPQWLVEEFSAKLPLVSLKLGEEGIDKKIFLGVREADSAIDYINGFLEIANHAAEVS